ncbi:MAG: hypothetical protein K2Q32_00760 [Alphaproteobacteria bacterium]|nr:hypothetical protein [Alphaproteobacteria bacterium]
MTGSVQLSKMEVLDSVRGMPAVSWSMTQHGDAARMLMKDMPKQGFLSLVAGRPDAPVVADSTKIAPRTKANIATATQG